MALLSENMIRLTLVRAFFIRREKFSGYSNKRKKSFEKFDFERNLKNLLS
ncbi:Uncharacterised protein [uncultured archaeon]|nr:Uncharacterised protein [uncultured archaeon]